MFAYDKHKRSINTLNRCVSNIIYACVGGVIKIAPKEMMNDPHYKCLLANLACTRMSQYIDSRRCFISKNYSHVWFVSFNSSKNIS